MTYEALDVVDAHREIYRVKYTSIAIVKKAIVVIKRL